MVIFNTAMRGGGKILMRTSLLIGWSSKSGILQVSCLFWRHETGQGKEENMRNYALLSSNFPQEPQCH